MPDFDNFLTLPGEVNSLDEVDDFVSAAAKEAGLNPQRSYQLRLAVDEIVTNAITHGYEEHHMEGCIRLSARKTPESLVIVVEDTAPAFDPTKMPLPNNLELPLEERSAGGLGVFLAMRGVDRYFYERIDGKNRNTLVVFRNGGP